MQLILLTLISNLIACSAFSIGFATTGGSIRRETFSASLQMINKNAAFHQLIRTPALRSEPLSVTKAASVASLPSQGAPRNPATAPLLSDRDVYPALRIMLQCLAAYTTVEAVSMVGQLGHAESLAAAAGALAWAIASATTAMTAFLSTPMDPEGDALRPSAASGVARFSKTKEGWLLCQPMAQAKDVMKAETLFIFYCGAKLDPTHYRGIALENAKLGISTLIVQSPFNVPFLPISHPRDVISAMSERFSRFVLGGHSLGAARAAEYARELSADGTIAGLVLMGSSATGMIEHDISSLTGPDGAEFPVASVFASNDGFYGRVVQRQFQGDEDKYVAKTEALLPAGGFVRRVAGGTHFGFADVTFGVEHGFPFPDLDLEIERTDQQRLTAEAVADVVTLKSQTSEPAIATH